MLLKNCESGFHLNTGVDLLWAYNTSTSHIESYAKYDCLAKVYLWAPSVEGALTAVMVGKSGSLGLQDSKGYSTGKSDILFLERRDWNPS